MSIVDQNLYDPKVRRVRVPFLVVLFGEQGSLNSIPAASAQSDIHESQFTEISQMLTTQPQLPIRLTKRS